MSMYECFHIHLSMSISPWLHLCRTSMFAWPCLNACGSVFACPNVPVAAIFCTTLLVPAIPTSKSQVMPAYPRLHVLHVCISVSASLHVHVCMFMSPWLSTCACPCLRVCMSMPLSWRGACPSLHVCMPGSLHVHVCISACPCLHACMAACPCLHGCASMSAWLHVHAKMHMLAGRHWHGHPGLQTLDFFYPKANRVNAHMSMSANVSMSKPSIWMTYNHGSFTPGSSSKNITNTSDDPWRDRS